MSDARVTGHQTLYEAGLGLSQDPGDDHPDRTGVGVRIVVGALAAILVAAAAVLPLWESRLSAPQYPDGLRVVIYGHAVKGDIAEIDTLNHYIGMRAFDPADVPEMGLWPVGLGVALLAVGIAIFAHRSVAARLARIYLWLLPLSVLAIIQLRLYQFGHDLDPGAALRIPEFTPWVIGQTTVWNFTSLGLPGLGTIALLVAAAMLSSAAWRDSRAHRAAAHGPGS